MNWLNSNLFHNVANIISAALALVVVILLATGCTQDAITMAVECSKSVLDPKWAAAAIMAVQVLKMVVNIARDGISGLVKPQPPVDKSPKANK